ncbi:MAG: TIGR03960 family B12-binding radical SAM protein [Desulfobacterales bacterium]|nr:TIGR03960 family B12-binding radical SAM protein [Desulfobacterales bacterium]
MDNSTIDDIRPLVSKPSRYLGSEINTVKKPPDTVNLRMALAFPDLYDIGTSHFGLQILYQILNNEPDISAERVFTPGLDMAACLRRANLPLFSLETQTPLADFDIIGFSLLYELNFTNVLAMLELAGIPFRQSQRNASHPLVIAGGPCTCNPEPMAEFFDAMVVGDGESVILEMVRAWREWAKSGQGDRGTLLYAWSRIEGVYIPAFFEPYWDEDGFQRLTPKLEGYTSVSRAIVPDLDGVSFPDHPIVPFGKPIHDRLRVELARGCTRGCRFCQAGMIYRPVRERSLSNLRDLAETALNRTGYEDISLLSLSTGDYSCLSPLMKELILRHSSDPVAISLPSFRAGTLAPEMMELVKKVRKTGFTIAPEAGSERLRRVINKNISEAEILETVTQAFSLGWRTIKLYFMIGLPSETEADIDAIVDLVHKIRRKKGIAGRKATINVSVATFIPKPHTPFQWQAQLPVERAKKIIGALHHRLNLPGVHFKWQNPEVSRLEGLWARGDRRLADLLEAAYQKGCQFDGWSDTFDYDAWLAACRDTGVDIDFFISRTRAFDEPLPWDGIDCRIDKAFLREENEKAIGEAATGDCRLDACSGCGACDFETVRPRLAVNKTDFGEILPAESEAGNESSVENRLRMRYAKLESAKYFGHLELIHIFQRALRRAGIGMKYTQGFHPKPKCSFHEAIPVGVESRCETFYLTVAGEIDCDQAVRAVNRELPPGLTLIDCRKVPPKSGPEPEAIRVYEIYQKDGAFDAAALDRFKAADTFRIKRRTQKGRTLDIDLAKVVRDIRLENGAQLLLSLNHLPGQTVRPGEALQVVFGLSTESVLRLKVIKLPAEKESSPI